MGNDSLTAWFGDDILHGGEGDDILESWLGYDQLNGGAGDDTLINIGYTWFRFTHEGWIEVEEAGNGVYNGGDGIPSTASWTAWATETCSSRPMLSVFGRPSISNLNGSRKATLSGTVSALGDAPADPDAPLRPGKPGGRRSHRTFHKSARHNLWIGSFMKTRWPLAQLLTHLSIMIV